MSACVLDTDIFSETIKRKSPRVVERAELYVQEHARLAITVMTLTEVISGYQQMQREALTQRLLASLSHLDILPLTPVAAVLAGRIMGDLRRTGQPIGTFDPLIAAIAILHDRTLVTGNRRHYQRIADLGYSLRLDDWRDPSLA